MSVLTSSSRSCCETVETNSDPPPKVPFELLTRVRKRSAPTTTLIVLARTLPMVPGSTASIGTATRWPTPPGIFASCRVRNSTGVPLLVLTNVLIGIVTSVLLRLLKTTSPVALDVAFCVVPLAGTAPFSCWSNLTTRAGNCRSSTMAASIPATAVIARSICNGSRPGWIVIVAAGST